jgi:hypothetical protein
MYYEWLLRMQAPRKEDIGWNQRLNIFSITLRNWKLKLSESWFLCNNIGIMKQRELTLCDS